MKPAELDWLPMPTTASLAAALGYAAAGWGSVLPLAGKIPLTAHGLRDASRAPEIIRSLWEPCPSAGVGLVLAEGLIVLDVDGDDGLASLRSLAGEHGQLPVTTTSRTGRGWHLLFRWPQHVPSPRRKIAWHPGLDIIVPGTGYICIAPTVHPSGARYHWARRVAPVALPGWLVDLLRVRPPTSTRAPYIAPQTSRAAGRRARYAHAVLVGEASAVAETGEGARNARLNKAWWRCSQFRDVLDRDHVARELTAAAMAAGLPEQEIGRVLR